MSPCKKKEKKSWDNTKAHFSIARNARNRWILWMIQVNFKKWNRITAGDCLTFPVSLQRFQVLVTCWAATNACLLTHGKHRDYRESFLVINFLRLIHPEIGLETLFARNVKQNRGTIPTPTFAGRPSTMSSTIQVDFPQNFMVGQQRHQISELQFDKFSTPSTFSCWKIRFTNQVTTCSDFPSEAMLWIKEMEMVDSLEELKSSRSVSGKICPNFEMLDAKIASALNKSIQNSQFKKKVSLEEQKAQKENRFLRGRQIAFMIYDYFRVTGAHDTVLDYADLFSFTLRDDNIQEFGTRWDEVQLSMSKIPSNDILESLYKLRIRESAQLKTVLEIVRDGN